MNIIAVTRALNEEDIVEPLIRHHAALVDHHIILDNGSVDRTVEILLALKAEGARITVLQNDSVIFSETQFNTLLYDLAVERFAADWVVYLDADEFIDPRGIGDLRTYLAGVPQSHDSVGVQLINYDSPSVATQHDINVVKRFSRRLPAPIDAWKVFVRGGIGAGRVTVDAGNHHMSVDGVQQEAMRQSDFLLAHYPNRSPLHWAGKAVMGRFKVLAAGQAELRLNRAHHYNEFVEILKKRPKDWVEHALARHAGLMTASALVDDPIVYLGADLRYTRNPDYGWRALSLGLANYEKLANAYGSVLDDHADAREDIYRAIRTVRVVAGDETLAQTFPPSPGEALGVGLRPKVRRYPVVSLNELVAEAAAQSGNDRSVEALPWLSAAPLEVPPLLFGESDLARPGLVIHPSEDVEAAGARHGGIAAYLLRGVLLHGKHGIISIGDRVLSESLASPVANVPATADWRRAGAVFLPDLPLSGTVHSAYHLLLGEVGNYYHWMIDAMSRFDPAQYRAFADDPHTAGAPNLLVPTLDVFWKWESLGLLVSRSVPRFALAAEGRVFVQRLLYVPDLSGGMFNPHPQLLRAFDAIRAAVLGVPPARPWRRLYISRADTGNRVLANEAEVIARAERAGFTPVLLSKLSVPDQVRLFAEASHILAPHGAGLTNIGYCQPGTVLCELHMDSYVHWAFRCLAALRGMRYGCLIGTVHGERAYVVHENTWTVDLAALDAVLASPVFT